MSIAINHTDTFPKILLHHAKTIPSHPAYREKYLGIWQETTWAQNLVQVSSFTCGLSNLGFTRGMNLAIIGDNRPRLYQAMRAAQCLGGIAVPLYQDAVATEMVHVLNDAQIGFAIVENQEQVDKLLEIKWWNWDDSKINKFTPLLCNQDIDNFIKSAF